MFQNIKWIFFDIGSTIVDETQAYAHRYQDIADASGVPYSAVSEKAETLFRTGQKGDKIVASQLCVPLPRWHCEDERLFPDAVDCLKYLHQKYKLGIIANQVAGTRDRLCDHQILDYFDAVVASAEEGCAKPDKEIFQIALSRSNCIAQNAVMIGDRIDNDILPAKQLGMKTIWIRQGYGKHWIFSDEAEIPDFSVSHLYELCAIL